MGLVITLILVGIILIFVEILLIPGVGIAGILGLLSLCGSSYFAFDIFGPLGGTIVTLIDIALVTILVFYALRAKTWKKLELDTILENKPESHFPAIGDKGKTITRLGPMGSARIDNETYEVTALEGMIDSGTDIEVVHIENNKIYVKPVMSNDAF